MLFVFHVDKPFIAALHIEVAVYRKQQKFGLA